jgi:hypothetical protein
VVVTTAALSAIVMRVAAPWTCARRLRGAATVALDLHQYFHDGATPIQIATRKRTNPRERRLFITPSGFLRRLIVFRSTRNSSFDFSSELIAPARSRRMVSNCALPPFHRRGSSVFRRLGCGCYFQRIFRGFIAAAAVPSWEDGRGKIRTVRSRDRVSPQLRHPALERCK